ncbi:unnamed protein product [Urochloa humidicola]
MNSDLEQSAGPIVGLDYNDDHILRAPRLRFSVVGYPHGRRVSDGGGEEECRQLITTVDAALAPMCVQRPADGLGRFFTVQRGAPAWWVPGSALDAGTCGPRPRCSQGDGRGGPPLGSAPPRGGGWPAKSKKQAPPSEMLVPRGQPP